MPKPVVRFESGVTIVTLGTEFETIDHAAVDQFDEVLELANVANPPRVIFELRHTKYMSSAFLGLLFEIRRRLDNRADGRLAICCASQHCKDVFAITRLDSLFEMFETSEDAIAAYANDIGFHPESPNFVG